MKKVLCIIISLFMFMSLCSCNVNSQPGDISNTKIDYGTSEKYSKEDIDSAIQVVFDEFRTWNGFEMYTIHYTGDENCDEDELEYCKSLNEEAGFVDCIVFKSSFRTAKNCDNGFNSDEIYSSFEWHLAREADGEWQLLTWGY